MKTCVVCGSKFSSKMCPLCCKNENEKQILTVEQNYLPIGDRINDFLTKEQQEKYKKHSVDLISKLRQIDNTPNLSVHEKFTLKLKVSIDKIKLKKINR